MEMKDAACCSGSWSPLGAAEWSPQDFTLFLINYSHDLSANVWEGSALDNTCKEKVTHWEKEGIQSKQSTDGQIKRVFVCSVNR